jgi:hypothetical protein
MATKAEQFRVEQQRASQPPRARAPRRPRRDTPVDTSLPGISASDRKVGATSTALRNRSDSAARRTGVSLEDSKTGTPSRKSTRRSTGRVKTAANLQSRQTRKVTSPKVRADSAGAKPTRHRH